MLSAGFYCTCMGEQLLKWVKQILEKDTDATSDRPVYDEESDTSSGLSENEESN